jgi:hypothetical protein
MLEYDRDIVHFPDRVEPGISPIRSRIQRKEVRTHN